jgi:uncharacterized membrane protein YphA (DoxX/SURF4 family)
MTFLRSKTCWWIALALRVILGGLFILAAYLKLQDSWRIFAMDIAAYGVLPNQGIWLELVARTLPWLEAALGLWLISGIWLRASATLSAALLLGFIGLMTWARLNGLSINCGCFGSGEKISWITMLRDGSLLAAAVTLAAWSYMPRKMGSDAIS